MIEAPSEFELVEFEQVEAAPGTALLRVTARPGRDPDAAPPALLIADGGRVPHRVEPLPSPPGPQGILRVAFSAPLDVVRRGSTFALELADGSVVRLPAPSRRRPPRSHDGIAAEAERRRLADGERLRALEIERRRAVDAERQRAVESERLRGERDQALADRNRALMDRNHALSDREEAESRARAASAGTGALEAQVRSAEESAARLQSELEAQTRSAKETAARLQSELEAQTRSAKETAARLQSERDAALQETQTQRRKVVELSEQIARVRAELETIRTEADATRTEGERAKRRISELTRALERSEERESVAGGEVESLRERLAERAAHEADSERLQVIEEALVVRDAEIELLNATVSDLLDHFEEHADARERAAAHVELLEGERAQLSEEHQRLADEFAQLSDERARLLEEHGRLLDEKGRLLDEHSGLQTSADQLFVQLEESRLGSLAALDLLRNALLEHLHGR